VSRKVVKQEQRLCFDLTEKWVKATEKLNRVEPVAQEVRANVSNTRIEQRLCSSGITFQCQCSGNVSNTYSKTRYNDSAVCYAEPYN
jgi:hypothetical protein